MLEELKKIAMIILKGVVLRKYYAKKIEENYLPRVSVSCQNAKNKELTERQT